MEEPAAPPPPLPPWFPGGQRLAFLLLLIGILVVAYYTIQSLVTVLLLAAAVASLSFGWHRWLTTRLGGRPRTAAALMVTMVLAGVLGPATALAVLGAQRIAVEAVHLVPHLDEAQVWLADHASRLGPLGPPAARAVRGIGASITSAAPTLARRASEWASAVGSALLRLGVDTFLFSVSLFYFYIEGEGWRERLIRLVPINPRYAVELIDRFRRTALAVLVGNLGTALVHGVIAGAGYWIFGVEGPLLWGVATGFASFIPAIGTALVWVPLSIALAVSTSWVRGLLLLAYCIVIVGTADNVARPLLMQKRLGLHPLWVFVAVFGGVTAYGISGLFLGPLIMALAVAVLDIYEKEGGAELLVGD